LIVLSIYKLEWQEAPFGFLLKKIIPLFAILLSLILFRLVWLILKKAKNINAERDMKFNDLDKDQKCKNIKNCWCSDYDLKEEKKKMVLKEFGEQNCGKTASFLIAND